MKKPLETCPVCLREPLFGRTQKQVKGHRGRGFVAFCAGAEGDEPKHHIEIEGYPRSAVVRAWNEAFGLLPECACIEAHEPGCPVANSM